MKKLLAVSAALFCLAASLLLCGMGMIFAKSVFLRAAYPDHYRETVEQVSRLCGADRNILFAVIYSESNFNPNVMTSVGARGLMQITPDTLDWVRYRLGESALQDPSILFQPEKNIYYGGWTLSLLTQEFGNIKTALAAYHAGWGNVTRWLDNPDYSKTGCSLDVIPFGDTRTYVKKVMATAAVYHWLYTRDDGGLKTLADYQRNAYHILTRAVKKGWNRLPFPAHL